MKESQRQILRALRRHRKDGLTIEETWLQGGTDFAYITISQSMRELLRAGRIIKGGTRLNLTGRQHVAWYRLPRKIK